MTKAAGISLDFAIRRFLAGGLNRGRSISEEGQVEARSGV